MALLHRLIVLIPLILSIVGTILSALSLFAGHKQGFMEDYAIARVSPSTNVKSSPLQGQAVIILPNQLLPQRATNDELADQWFSPS